MSGYKRPSSNTSTNSTRANNLIISIAPWNAIKRKGSSTNCGSRKPVAGLAAQPRAQQLHEAQKQLDQLQLEQQLHRVQQDLKLHAIEREPNPLRRQQQIRELELQQQRQFLQDQ